MRKIMLMRHGDYHRDSLSEDGQQKVDAVAEQMAKEGLIPEVILHSPIKRAVETAQRMQAVFNRVAGKNVPLVGLRSLELGCETEDWELYDAINGNNSAITCALAVTHQPNVECLSRQFGNYVSPNTAEVSIFESDVDTWAAVSRPRLVKKL